MCFNFTDIKAFYRKCIILLTFILTSFSAIAQSPAADWVDVSHSIGIPFGGLGNGYSVLGKYGFVKVNFDGKPDDFDFKARNPSNWSYTLEPQKKSTYGFRINSEKKSYILQETAAEWAVNAIPANAVKAYAHLPEGLLTYKLPGANLEVSVNGFTPLIPHLLAVSNTPIQIFDVKVVNTGSNSSTIQIQLLNISPGDITKGRVSFTNENGNMTFAANNAVSDRHGVSVTINIQPHSQTVKRFYISWYYPHFSQNKSEPGKRYYTQQYHNSSQVIDTAIKQAENWKRKVSKWHQSLNVPAYFKRLWFSSLSSVMTSTMLSDKPYFFEIETPHGFLNTMDVDVYSSWIYLINWPELEKTSMNMYTEAMPLEGKKAGYVWHSLWSDTTHYVEEPIFLARYYRDHLWFNDLKWTRKIFPYAVLAANRVYKDEGFEYQINSKHGNQSYDLWKMPGISAFVNSGWIYGLNGFNNIATKLQKKVDVQGIPLNELSKMSAIKFDQYLWNPTVKDWNCFYRTPDAEKGSNPESVFSDQLIGKWITAIDRESSEVLPSKKVSDALNTIYTNNLIEDKEKMFRGWSNGMLPGHLMDPSGRHSHMFWFGPQINLGSLLGLEGREQESIDVFKSLEMSLHNNHLAAGEWNQSIDKNLVLKTLAEEPGKDTPRFPAYPRYKSSWEYLIRLLGLQIDEQYLYLKPFKTLNFSMDGLTLAGVKLDVTVHKGWKKVLVDGRSLKGNTKISRSAKFKKIEFI